VVLAASNVGGNLVEGGGHGGSGVAGDGGLTLITRALLGVAISGWGLSLSKSSVEFMLQEGGYIRPKRCAR
jgi:hypothetical protein